MIAELEDLRRWVPVPAGQTANWHFLAPFIRVFRGSPVVPPALVELVALFGLEALRERMEKLQKMVKTDGPATTAVATLNFAKMVLRDQEKNAPTP